MSRARPDRLAGGYGRACAKFAHILKTEVNRRSSVTKSVTTHQVRDQARSDGAGAGLHCGQRVRRSDPDAAAGRRPDPERQHRHRHQLAERLLSRDRRRRYGRPMINGSPGAPYFPGSVQLENAGTVARAVIRWGGNSDSVEDFNPDGFNIGQNATFFFTSAANVTSAAVLNIDASGNPSQIFGRLIGTSDMNLGTTAADSWRGRRCGAGDLRGQHQRHHRGPAGPGAIADGRGADRCQPEQQHGVVRVRGQQWRGHVVPGRDGLAVEGRRARLHRRRRQPVQPAGGVCAAGRQRRGEQRQHLRHASDDHGRHARLRVDHGVGHGQWRLEGVGAAPVQRRYAEHGSARGECSELAIASRSRTRARRSSTPARCSRRAAAAS